MEYDKAKLIFLNEIATRNADISEQMKAQPESIRQIAEASVAALRESVQAGTSEVARAVLAIPKSEPLRPVIDALLSLANVITITGNKENEAINRAAAAVIEAVKSIPAPEAKPRKWAVKFDRNFDTGLIQEPIIIEAVE